MLNILGVVFDRYIHTLQTSQTSSGETSHITVYFNYFVLSSVCVVFRSIKFEITDTLGKLFANAFGLLCQPFLSV